MRHEVAIKFLRPLRQLLLAEPETVVPPVVEPRAPAAPSAKAKAEQDARRQRDEERQRITEVLAGLTQAGEAVALESQTVGRNGGGRGGTRSGYRFPAHAPENRSERFPC